MSEFLSDQEIDRFVAAGGYSGVATSGKGANEEDDQEAGGGSTWQYVPPGVEQFDDLRDILRAHLGSKDLLVWTKSDATALGLARPIMGMTVENRFVLPVSEVFNLSQNTWYVLDVRGDVARGQYVLSGPVVSGRMFFRPVTEHEIVVLNSEPSSPFFVMGVTEPIAGESSGDGLADGVESRSDGRDSSTRVALRVLLRDAAYEDFETGMESVFERELSQLISKAGEEAIVELRALLLSESTQSEVIAQTLGVLGRLQDTHTRRIRLSVLHEYLSHPSIVVRDAAVMGIAEMEDEESVPHLENARKTETCDQLRDEMDSVLADLSR